MELYYTTINHKARIKFKISLIDYCIADTIYHLSNSPKSKTPGWCYASKDYFAEILDVGRRSVFRSLKTLLKKKLIEQNPENQRQLRTTPKWFEKVIMDKECQNGTVSRNSAKMALKARQNGTGSLALKSVKVAHNNYNKDNITNKIPVVKRISNWAFKRASTSPSCSEKAFSRTVEKAIKSFGYPAVLKLYVNEENAIRFLTNLKGLK